jgi:hypothetical protein
MLFLYESTRLIFGGFEDLQYLPLSIYAAGRLQIAPARRLDERCHRQKKGCVIVK